MNLDLCPYADWISIIYLLRKPTLINLELVEKEGMIFDLTYDYPEWDPHMETYYDQEVIAQERLDTDERELRCQVRY